MRMRIQQKKGLTFGDFIVAVYQVWGKGLAEKIVQSALNARLLVFRDQAHVLISSAKGRSL